MTSQPRPSRRRATGIIASAAILVLLTACSRGVTVSTSPAVTYAVNVTNATGHDLAVSWDDGEGPRALGLVPVGRSERFIIAMPRRTSVTISGATPDGSRTFGPVNAELRPGTPVNVVLR